jgi:hypothetical protein
MADAATSSSKRVLAFAAITVGCVAVAGVSLATSVLKTQDQRQQTHQAAAAVAGDVDTLLASRQPLVVFRTAKADQPGTGQLSVAGIGAQGPTKAFPLDVECARVSFSAAGSGLCLHQSTTHGFKATLLDRKLKATRSLRLVGIPSRTRISADGKLGTITAFVRGDSYLTAGLFSTRTTIVDMTTGKVMADLEKFKVTHDGKAVTAADRNFWGVTFVADGDTFYATMSTGSVHYLIQGSIRKRTAQTVRDQVECPSLSPDGSRIAYKHLERLPGGVGWKIKVYDLRSRAETPLAETETVDDQVSWLDDNTVLYAKGDDTWTMPADGTGKARPWLRGGVSPIVVRR